MKKILNAISYKLGFRLLSLNSPLTNAFKAQKYLITKTSPTIFDIGAHEGETSLMYNANFDNPCIYSFEPFLPSFEKLKDSLKSFPNIKIFNTAISNFTGEVDFHVNKSSATNSILPTSGDSEKNWGENIMDTIDTIRVSSMTIDDFVEKFKIETIDILKIDTQGTEYEIIEGAGQSIEQNKIKIIYLEIIIVSTYQRQKYPDEIFLLLRNKGFQLFNLYNYTYSDKGELKQFDALFIHNEFDLPDKNL